LQVADVEEPATDLMLASVSPFPPFLLGLSFPLQKFFISWRLLLLLLLLMLLLIFQEPT
jgi:hypothetical protein